MFPFDHTVAAIGTEVLRKCMCSEFIIPPLMIEVLYDLKNAETPHSNLNLCHRLY